MKKALRFLLLTLLLTPLVLTGQTLFKINQYNIIDKGNLFPILTLYTNHQFNDHLAATAYFYINGYEKGSWGEGLGGVTYTPVKGVSVGFLVGFQTNETELWRISPLLILGNEHWSFFGAFEFGGRRYRWDAMGFYLWKKFKFGAELIRYYQMYAAGPRIEVSFFKNPPVTLFYTALFDLKDGHYSSMFGIYTSFGVLKQQLLPDD
jgi:hypothetical protein